MNNLNTIEQLAETIKARQNQMPNGSYTASLFQKGENVIVKKLGEEFVEMIVEFSREDKQRMVSETTDFLYHLLVMLSLKNISLDELYEEIEKRAK